jgi:hypothetical protein
MVERKINATKKILGEETTTTTTQVKGKGKSSPPKRNK